MRADNITEVRQLFDGRSVLMTGASGFIGSVLLEKLLRCYEGIKCIYIVLRSKKNDSPIKRLHNGILNSPLFDRVRELEKNDGRKLFEKIVIVPGDLGEPGLGISETDRQMLINDPTLSIVFSLAASVRFNEDLQGSANLNLIGVDSLIKLCKRLPNLISFCHVSTAFVNGRMYNGEVIEEKIYPIEQSPYDIMHKAKTMSKDELEKLAVEYLKRWPNTYTYTKSLAEHLLARECSDMPVAIVRPSIVVSAHKEPWPGWVNSLNGITGVVLACSIGLLRTIHIVRNIRVDIIPVDYVVNTSIAAAYYIAKNRVSLSRGLVSPSSEPNGQQQGEIAPLRYNTDDKLPAPIFHCTSGDVNLLWWGELEDLVYVKSRLNPSMKMVRVPWAGSHKTKFGDNMARIFKHYLPALVIDTVAGLRGTKKSLYTTYSKLHSKMTPLTYFSSHEYILRSDNIKLLQDCLTSETDKRELFLDLKQVDWDDFFKYFILGIR